MVKKLVAHDKEELTTEILILLENENISEREAIKRIMTRKGIKDWRVRGSAHRLALETLRRKNLIDKIIRDNLKDWSSFNKFDPFMKNLMRVAVFQMKFSDKSSALVTNQALEILKRHVENPKQISFLNAILRQIEQKTVKEYLQGKNEIENLSLKYFYPSWLIRLLIKEFNMNFAEKFITEPPLENHFRINTLKIPIKNALEKLKAHGYQIEQDKNIPELIKLISYKQPITRSKLHLKGMLYIQSKSSILVSRILDPRPGETVADICAAPGGKTTHIAQLMENQGILISLELFSKRIPELLRIINKLGVKITHVINGDAKIFNHLIRLKFDRVLIDPPCSGTGTLQTRPSTKWKLSSTDIPKFAGIQQNILRGGAKTVKTGGILVYSTCSIMKEENEQVLEIFLKENEDFKILKIERKYGTPGLDNFPEAIRLYPQVDETEGFFIAKFQKIY